VIADGMRVILDAGTGMRPLGNELARSDIEHIFLLLTHAHWDHINGLPFFRPAYDSARRMHIFAGHLKDSGGIQQVLSQQMHEPVFPVPLDAMKAIVECEDFRAGDRFELMPGVMLQTAPLNHPNGATGYRLEHDGVAVCYVTDTEHVPGKPDENVLSLIAGADLVIYDSTYTEEEFEKHRGWGHSTWNEGARLCQAAGARRLAIFHHDPEHHDDFMDRLAAEAKETWPAAFIARDMQTVLVQRG
jgi:phosphoribosyl 1,2-cyclic phosphodiesterase